MSSIKNEVKKIIHCDNLEVSFSGNIPTMLFNDNNYNRKRYINSQCFIEFTNNSNRFFENIAKLWIDSRLIGEFRFNTTAPFIKGNLINFKFENVQLYQHDFIRYIDYIIETFDFKYLYISHLDLAIDCIDHSLIKFINDYLYYSNTKNYTTKHKGKIDKKNIITNNINEIYWGKIKSEKYIKIYDKSLELLKSDKPYIPASWKENKMIVENKIVERFELTLKQKHTKKLDYTRLTDSNYLASIVETHCLKYFQFIKTTKRNNKIIKKDVTPIDFNDFNTVLLPKFKHIKQVSLFNEKRELKQLLNQYLQAQFIANDQNVEIGITKVPECLKDYSTYIKTIENVLYQYPTLNSYYNSKKKSWTNEFNNTNDLKRGIISIDSYVESILLTQQLKFNREPENDIKLPVNNTSIYEYSTYDEIEYLEDIEENEIITDKEKKDSYRLTDIKLHELERSCKNANLKKLGLNSELIKKTSYEITNEVDHRNKINSMLRNIA